MHSMTAEGKKFLKLIGAKKYCSKTCANTASRRQKYIWLRDKKKITKNVIPSVVKPIVTEPVAVKPIATKPVAPLINASATIKKEIPLWQKENRQPTKSEIDALLDKIFGNNQNAFQS